MSNRARPTESVIASATIPRADLYILGSGVLSFFDVTLYTQSILRQCKTVFLLHDLPTLERYVGEITPNPVNLLPMYYLDGRIRLDIYEDIVRHVVDATEKAKPNAFLLHGHPLVYSTLYLSIIEKCIERGIRVEIVPAVSSLDRLFVDLRLSISERGLQVFLAGFAIDERISLNPYVHSIFCQIGHTAGAAAMRGRSSLPEEATPLKQYLLEFYPPEHLVHVVESAVELGFESRNTPSELGRLEEIATAMTYNSSLFVPALNARQP